MKKLSPYERKIIKNVLLLSFTGNTFCFNWYGLGRSAGDF